MADRTNEKILLVRAHRTGAHAEVILQADGHFHARRFPAPSEGTPSIAFQCDIEDLGRAKQLADHYAHPSCDGNGCAEWRIAPETANDPACQAALSNE